MLESWNTIDDALKKKGHRTLGTTVDLVDQVNSSMLLLYTYSVYLVSSCDIEHKLKFASFVR